MVDLKHANSVQLSIHQADMESLRAEIQRLWQEHAAQLEVKDAFCDAEKVCVFAELQANYQSKLLIGVDLISIYRVFCMYFCNLNARFTPIFIKIKLIPHLLMFCRNRR